MLAIIKNIFSSKSAAQKVAESIEFKEMSADSWWS